MKTKRCHGWSRCDVGALSDAVRDVMARQPLNALAAVVKQRGGFDKCQATLQEVTPK